MERKGKDSESRKYGYVLIGYFVSQNRNIEKGRNKVAWQMEAALAIVRPHGSWGRSLSHTSILGISAEQIVGQC